MMRMISARWLGQGSNSGADSRYMLHKTFLHSSNRTGSLYGPGFVTSNAKVDSGSMNRVQPFDLCAQLSSEGLGGNAQAQAA